MGVVRKFILGDFACSGTEHEFVLVIKNKIYGPFKNCRYNAILNALENNLIIE
ncbi:MULTISPECIES: hypothetical protein [Bacillus]|uniref:hypothetical protein n=1 Tax=Bacillus TaxID=1386 RepID=UPI0013EED9DA|nr:MULTISPECIES: hypothetical protein [unclassified Bacillus (in: firmicutes)]KAF6604303.1 hypothetical protein G9F48_04385 [Bacillus sp. EKM420B]KAF6609130.1 hypothetical protein G9F49_04370 [Bacillus sp. EKM417B]